MKFFLNFVKIASFALIFNSCSAQTNFEKLEVLLGTWQVEGKQTFEVWNANSKNEFKGTSYKMKNNSKHITETLLITQNDKDIVYEATVPNQNQGKGISFTLNTKESDKFSFENLEHDFPKKIQYQVISKYKLFVQVLGDNDQGFSYYLIK